MILIFAAIQHLTLDWISGNWYFLDISREIIFLCNSTLSVCTIILEVDLSKPRGMALDPTKGFMFFTKWGHSPPMLERALLDGTNRTTLVHQKIVYPYDIAVDFPLQHIYWVDSYLDFVERINYDGTNRRTVKRGAPVQNLYSVAVFENNLLVSSWKNQNIIKLNKFKAAGHQFVGDLALAVNMPLNVKVFHRQVQPDGKYFQINSTFTKIVRNPLIFKAKTCYYDDYLPRNCILDGFLRY